MPSRLIAQDGLAFRTGLGFQRIGGDWGQVLDAGIDARFASMYSTRGARVGLELSWASLGMDEFTDRTWNQGGGRFFVGYAPTLVPGIRPYGELGLTFRRMHPEGDRFFRDEPPREYPADVHTEGPGLDVSLGVELSTVSPVALDLSAGYGRFTTRLELPSDGLDATTTGSSWRIGLGVTWFPLADPRAASESVPGFSGAVAPARSGTDVPVPDAWGVEPARGLSLGVATVTGLLVPWTWNMFVTDKQWSQISPRSWWKGSTQGFAWDDNKFYVNHLRHPYQGSLYFNSARSNGFDYWTGFLYATVGSFVWECCIETHLASIPDMFTTALGGAAFGEALYRTSSLAIDNTAGGGERVFREALGAVISPARELTRLLTGRAWQAGANPVDPLDHVPEALEARFETGARYVVEAAGSEEKAALPFVGLDISSGDPFQSRWGPFDYYRGRIQLNSGDETLIGEVEIRGGLWATRPGRLLGGDSRIIVFQDFDYVTAWAYKYSAQRVAGAWVWRERPRERVTVQTTLEGSFSLIGSVNSEFAAFAEIEGIQVRERLYDFGYGPGAGLTVELMRGQRRLVEAKYDLRYLATLNGSNVSGTSSRHLVQFASLAVHGRLLRQLGFGFDVDLFMQDSEYGFAGFDDSYTSQSRARVFLSWSPDLG